MENTPQWKFLPTMPFRMDYGRMAKADYERLKSDISDRKGTLIPAAAGLHQITIDIRGPAGRRKDDRSAIHSRPTAGWLVVYAIYKKWRLVVLVTKFKCPFRRKKFNFREQMALAAMKKRLDHAVKKQGVA